MEKEPFRTCVDAETLNPIPYHKGKTCRIYMAELKDQKECVPKLNEWIQSERCPLK